MVNYVRPEEGYGIKDISKEIAAEERLKQSIYASDPIPVQTKRQWIAQLIRQLTYRELKQIEEELLKCQPHEESLAQMLDDWAHMVKEETEGNTVTQKVATIK